MFLKFIVAGVALVTTAFVSSNVNASPVNLVQNPGFETGDFTSWNAPYWHVATSEFWGDYLMRGVISHLRRRKDFLV